MVGIHRERIAYELFRSIEVERLAELYACARHHGVGAARGNLQRLREDFFGVSWIVLVQVKVGTPEQGLDSPPFGTLAFVVGAVGILCMT